MSRSATNSGNGNQIPVVDLHDSPEPWLLGPIINQIADACESSGFFVITGHRVPGDVILEVDREARWFFEQPLDAKELLLAERTDPLMRGFGWPGALAASRTEEQDSAPTTAPDLCETYTYNRLGDPATGRAVAVQGIPYFENKWPARHSFRVALETYYASMAKLADDLLRVMAVALGLPLNHFTRHTSNHMSNMVMNFYPKQNSPPQPGQMRRGEHTDWGTVTVLHRDETRLGSLEVLMPEGRWCRVPEVEGGLVVNLGDLMRLWTGGKWRSSCHRVVNPPSNNRSEDRYSIAFFQQPDADAKISSIDGRKGHQSNPAVTSGSYLMAKTLQSFDLNKESNL